MCIKHHFSVCMNYGFSLRWVSKLAMLMWDSGQFWRRSLSYLVYLVQMKRCICTCTNIPFNIFAIYLLSIISAKILNIIRTMHTFPSYSQRIFETWNSRTKVFRHSLSLCNKSRHKSNVTKSDCYPFAEAGQGCQR